jgi:hypothetical protein
MNDGTRMKEFAEAGKITVGVRYDQPGLGFQGATDDIPAGFDAERLQAAPTVVVRTTPARVRSGGGGDRRCDG